MSAISRRSRRNSSGALGTSFACWAAVMARRSVAPRLIAGSAPETGDAAMLGTAGQKAAQGGEQLRLVRQEAVVPLVGLDLDKADMGGDGVQRVHQRATLGSREQPVAGEGDRAKPRLRPGKGGRQRPAMLGREVEIVHRPRDVEIGVGVKAVDKSAALVAQIALDLEIRVEPVSHGVAVLQVAAEFA